MILIFLINIAAALQSETIVVSGREMMTLENSQQVFAGTCDGREATATVTKAYGGAEGRIVLRSGRLTREIPPSFLGGRLLESTHYAAGLGCDGERLMFRARATQMMPDGTVRVTVQHVTMDLETGELSISSIRTMPPEEVRRELH